MFVAIFMLSPPSKDKKMKSFLENVKYLNFKANIFRFFVLNYRLRLEIPYLKV